LSVGSLFLISFPSLGDVVGDIKSITNAMEPGSRSMTWAYENQGGVIRGTRSYVQKARVITTNAFVGPIQIQQTLLGTGIIQGTFYSHPLPEINNTDPNAGNLPTTPTEFDTGSFLHTLNIEQDSEDAKQWLCTFSYGPYDINHEQGAQNQAFGSNNPLEKAPEAQWSAPVIETSYPTDANGIPWINTAGDMLENPPKRDEARQTLSFVRNEQNYNENYAQQFRQTVNQDNFLGFPPGCAKVKTITGKRIYTADYGYYWEVSYEFEFRVVTISVPETYDPITQLPIGTGTTTTYGFQDLVINAGYRQLVNGVKSQILIDGVPASVPVALDANGVPFGPDHSDGDTDASQNEVFWLVFQQYPSTTFANLNIPTNVLTASQ
jgi:hypothetical protein